MTPGLRAILFGGRFNPARLFRGGFTGTYIDPSDLSSVWQDSGGTTPGAVDSPVGLIQDRSGGAGHFSQATGAARPALKSAGGLYWLENDGVDDTMAAASALIPSAPPFTIMFAARFAAGTLGGLLAQYLGGAAGRLAYEANQDDDGAQLNGKLNPFIAGVTEGGGQLGAPLEQATGNDTAFIHSTISTTTGSEQTAIYLNGTETDRYTLPAVYVGANTRILGDSVLGFTTVKRLYGLLIINRALNAAEHLQMRQYLSGKSGAPAT